LFCKLNVPVESLKNDENFEYQVYNLHLYTEEDFESSKDMNFILFDTSWSHLLFRKFVLVSDISSEDT